MSRPRRTSSPASEPGDCAVIGVDDEPSRAVYRQAAARRRRRACRSQLRDAGRRRRVVPRRHAGRCRRLPGRLLPTCRPCRATTTRRTPPAPGRPAAGSTCRARGSSPACATYPGLPHRQERVASVGNVVYVNDSKATNADATARALSSYDDIYWILGGQAKEGGVAPLAPYFERIRHAFLIGEATELFAGQLDGKLAYSRCGDLKSALDAAHERAQREARRAAARRVCCRRPAPRGISGRVTSIAAMRSAPWRAPCRARRVWGGQRDPGSARRPQRDRPMVVDGRPLVAGRHPGASWPSA